MGTAQVSPAAAQVTAPPQPVVFPSPSYPVLGPGSPSPPQRAAFPWPLGAATPHPWCLWSGASRRCWGCLLQRMPRRGFVPLGHPRRTAFPAAASLLPHMWRDLMRPLFVLWVAARLLCRHCLCCQKETKKPQKGSAQEASALGVIRENVAGAAVESPRGQERPSPCAPAGPGR